MKIRNRVTELLGVEVPIVQAPMGWIARSQLASAVSNTGAMGIIEDAMLRQGDGCGNDEQTHEERKNSAP